MEEPAVQQEKIEGSWEGGHDEVKGDWKNERSLSSLLKHSCLLCWSSPRDTDEMEMDERALGKAAEIRELENAVAVENLELQEQQSDRRELEETLVKLETHKEKLVQQLKATRQLCYEESQQILSLQAEEVQKESQVEEYERELARARWRLRRLREQVKEAKRKVEEAGERNTPLQDSIRQSYEEILQEEHRLCSLSGSAVTPESQLEESASPADTTDDDPLPLRPWGRSQSLPAYADLIMGACGSSFYSNLTDKREGADDSGTSSTKMDKSDIEDEPEEERNNHEGDREKEECTITPNSFSQLDFYQANPFASCQSDHDIFHEDLFPKTETSDGFASDPFKGSDPFAADVLIPEANFDTYEVAGNPGDEADTSLSCAENKASTGTQCFESEFPDEDSDIEISYSREDLDTVGMVDDSCGFKPIQSSSEQLGPEPIHGWRSQGQYSVESDPNGYELDIGAISPPSDIEELSLGSLVNDTTNTAQAALEQGLGSYSAQIVSEQVLLKPDWTGDVEQSLLSCDITSSLEAGRSSKIEEVTHTLGATQNSVDFQNLFIHSDIDQNRELNFDLSYDSASQSSFDPYGFKLSPEHSSQQLLDPDEAELTSEPTEKDLTYDLKPSSSQPDQLVLDTYGFHNTSSQMVRDCDPYGFRLSPDEENQELLNICDYDNQETLDICTCVNNKQTEPTTYCSEEELETYTYENHEVLELCSHNNQGDLCNNGNQEVLESSGFANREIVGQQELLDHCSPVNQEVVEPFHNTCNQELLELCNYGNQEVLETDSHSNNELMDFGRIGNQEVLNSGSYNNQELLQHSSNENPESVLLSIDSHDNQEVLEFLSKEVVPEANNNQCYVGPELTPTYSSSDSDVATEDLLGLELGNTIICTTKNRNTNDDESPHMFPSQDLATSNALTRPCMLEGDLSSVFEAKGYIGCPDVADDLEPQDIRVANPAAEPLPTIRPIRPPRPSLKAKEKPQSQTQGIDLK